MQVTRDWVRRRGVTFVQMPIPTSIDTLITKEGSATSRSLKPGSVSRGPQREEASCRYDCATSAGMSPAL